MFQYDSAIVRLTETIAKIEALYIADGHHRAASAVRVGEMRRVVYFLLCLTPAALDLAAACYPSCAASSQPNR